VTAATKPRYATATAEQLGVRVFQCPPCARCGAQLADGDGNPRWDVVGRLTLVCLGGCRRQRMARKAALS
jgi:hypothetical protein